MIDPDNEERLLKVPPHVVKRIKAEAYAEAVEAVKARCSSDGEFMCVECEESVAAIEALFTNADNSTNVHERREAAAELTRMAQEDGLS